MYFPENENSKFTAKTPLKSIFRQLSKYCVFVYDEIIIQKGGKQLNQVALVGRITKDPFLREVARGRVQSNFVLAVSRNFKNGQGEVDTDFILCTLWGKLAENVVKHCGKGSLVGVSGRIQSRSFEREDGSRVYVTEVVADQVQFLATKRRSTGDLYKHHPSVQQSNKEQSEEVSHFQLPTKESSELPIT